MNFKNKLPDNCPDKSIANIDEDRIFFRIVQNIQLSEEDFKFLEETPFFIKINNLTILHAGITNKINLENASKKELDSLTRIRELDINQKMLALGQSSFKSRFWSEFYSGNEGIIVYGHEAINKVKIDKYSFGIDTGCVYGNKLTALVIFDTFDPLYNYDIVQVHAAKVYSQKITY